MSIFDKSIGKYKHPGIFIGDIMPENKCKCIICGEYFIEAYKLRGQYYCDKHFSSFSLKNVRREKIQKIKDDELNKQIDIQYRIKKLKAIDLLCQ